MAEITQKDVEYVAALAQLNLDEETTQRLVKEMGDILSYMDKLSELDTDSIEPMMHVMEISNIFREDEVGESLNRDKALDLAPKTDGEYYLVPRILESE
jgi:aspartyl-tRNA(Asn)/glutamyl-tRNA(Gln) amidotransferase subunit C